MSRMLALFARTNVPRFCQRRACWEERDLARHCGELGETKMKGTIRTLEWYSARECHLLVDQDGVVALHVHPAMQEARVLLERLFHTKELAVPHRHCNSIHQYHLLWPNYRIALHPSISSRPPRHTLHLFRPHHLPPTTSRHHHRRRPRSISRPALFSARSERMRLRRDGWRRLGRPLRMQSCGLVGARC